jgi:tetratricopeptide (TPR) repeat protein
MSNERLKQLREFYEQDPSDPFNAYALALEYQKVDVQKAAEFFEILLTNHADYLPTYYHAAKFFQDRGDRDRAINTYETGISLARRLGDQKAQRELKSAYDELIFE